MSKGVQGNFAAQVRVFAHDAVSLNPLNNNQIAGTSDRGVCLYIGGQGDVEVKMEGSSTPVVFKSVSAGTFLPILVTHVLPGNTTATEILALYQNMWLGIGYTIPQRGDRNLHIPVEGGFIISEIGDLRLLTENGNDEMVTEPTP